MTESPPGKTLSRRRRVGFIALSMALPVVLLLGFEGVLRLCGLGGTPPVVREVGRLGDATLVVTDTAGATSYFDSATSPPGSLDQYEFLSPKPPGTVRIVLAGGSAIKGFPQPMGFAPSAFFLEQMLAAAWPDRTVEVINLGTTAVASFPVLGMLTEMLAYEPDLAVIYTGHNEFYGAYGVASLHHGANSPRGIRWRRWTSSLAITALIRKFTRQEPSPDQPKRLMELVVGRTCIPSDSPLREQAAGNLYAHVTEMITRCRARGVSVLVCTPAANERGLAPIGRCDPDAGGAADRTRVDSLLTKAAATLLEDPASAVGLLEQALESDSNHAPTHFLLGRAHEAAGDPSRAAASYVRALDLDPMPWRAPTASVDAIRRAAKAQGVALCDVQRAFRGASPLGCAGWELFDDHVHPSLKGQWFLARAIIDALAGFSGPLQVSEEARARMPDFTTCLRRLNDNLYDRFGVVENLVNVFAVPFVRESNPEAAKRLERARADMLADMSPAARKAVDQWCDRTTHKGIRIPLSGMVARNILREGRFPEAEQLFGAARRHVPGYCGYHFEYTYFMLACRAQSDRGLSNEDRVLAAQTIEQIAFFLEQSDRSSGQPERYMGRLHQLLGDFADAIPLLVEARKKVSGSDALAVDMALLESLVKTGQLDRARELAGAGVKRGGAYGDIYRRFLRSIPDGDD